MMDHTWALEHYFEFYLLGGAALILLVYIIVYAWLDWRSEQKQQKARLTNAEALYHLKGYDARPNSRRA